MIIDAAINLELNSSDVYDPYRSGHDLNVFMTVRFFPAPFFAKTSADLESGRTEPRWVGVCWSGLAWSDGRSSCLFILKLRGSTLRRV